MWPKFYKDYPVDSAQIHVPVEPGKGIIGCEMHEINGWGNTLHHYQDRPNKRTRSRYRHSITPEKAP